MALCLEHPKRDQNPKFTPISETTSIPVCFIWESPPPPGGDITDVNVDLRLTVLKPLHAVWLVDLYNHLTSPVCVRLIAKGWEKAGISDLLDGQTDLPPEDPYTDIELALEIE